eukprot:scaffold664_cov260-Pinguiococcus_pyrenoidosus.AAC.40
MLAAQGESRHSAAAKSARRRFLLRSEVRKSTRPLPRFACGRVLPCTSFAERKSIGAVLLPLAPRLQRRKGAVARQLGLLGFGGGVPAGRGGGGGALARRTPTATGAGRPRPPSFGYLGCFPMLRWWNGENPASDGARRRSERFGLRRSGMMNSAGRPQAA